MEDVKETLEFDENSGKMHVKTSFVNDSVLAQNRLDRESKPEGFGKYKGNLVHVGRVHMGDVTRLMNMGYDLLSADPEESRRALLYIQTNEPHLLTVEGRPFSKVRKVWA